MSGGASQPTDYTNHQKNNQKGPVFDTGILVIVEEDVVGFQGHQSPYN